MKFRFNSPTREQSTHKDLALVSGWTFDAKAWTIDRTYSIQTRVRYWGVIPDYIAHVLCLYSWTINSPNVYIYYYILCCCDLSFGVPGISWSRKYWRSPRVQRWLDWWKDYMRSKERCDSTSMLPQSWSKICYQLLWNHIRDSRILKFILF